MYVPQPVRTDCSCWHAPLSSCGELAPAAHDHVDRASQLYSASNACSQSGCELGDAAAHDCLHLAASAAPGAQFLAAARASQLVSHACSVALGGVLEELQDDEPTAAAAATPRKRPATVRRAIR